MIDPVLLPIYGSLSIHAYGLCIAIGGLAAFALLCRDRIVKKIVSDDTLITLFQIILISGFLGGRIVEMLSQPYPLSDPLFLFRFWEPGLSILGAVVGIVLSLAIYLWRKKLSLLILLDRIALYAPLAQSFGRLGCFFAGCCYGIKTTNSFSVVYTHANHLAPLHCALHPAQLYSAFLLLVVFLFLYFVLQYHVQKRGILFCCYLMFIAVERFLIDFIRWDRVFIKGPSMASFFSLHQWIAFGIFGTSLIGVAILSKQDE